MISSLALASAAARAETGEQLAKSGNAAGAPACVTCHGAAGQGQGAAGFPRLAGLNAGYFAAQLRGFHDGTRANPIMGPIAKLLTAADAKALADYYAGLPAIDATGDAAASSSMIATGDLSGEPARADWIRFRHWVIAYRHGEFRVLGAADRTWDWAHVEVPDSAIGCTSIEPARGSDAECEFEPHLPRAIGSPASESSSASRAPRL